MRAITHQSIWFYPVLFFQDFARHMQISEIFRLHMRPAQFKKKEKEKKNRRNLLAYIIIVT